MRVQFQVSIASETWSFVPGQVVEVDGDEFTPSSIPAAAAAAWLECGHVVPVAPEIETASVSAPERAVRRQGRTR